MEDWDRVTRAGEVLLNIDSYCVCEKETEGHTLLSISVLG